MHSPANARRSRTVAEDSMAACRLARRRMKGDAEAQRLQCLRRTFLVVRRIAPFGSRAGALPASGRPGRADMVQVLALGSDSRPPSVARARRSRTDTGQSRGPSWVKIHRPARPVTRGPYPQNRTCAVCHSSFSRMVARKVPPVSFHGAPTIRSRRRSECQRPRPRLHSAASRSAPRQATAWIVSVGFTPGTDGNIAPLAI
jgi:hypothetical protein